MRRARAARSPLLQIRITGIPLTRARALIGISSMRGRLRCAAGEILARQIDLIRAPQLITAEGPAAVQIGGYLRAGHQVPTTPCDRRQAEVRRRINRTRRLGRCT
jgi:hypothetical protein